MNAYANKMSTHAIRLTRDLPGPIERVWAYLVESEKRGKWFASGTMPLEVDAQTILHFDHNSLTDHEEPIPESHKQVEGGIDIPVYLTACEPPHVLAWGQEPGRLETSDVIFELVPADNRVQMTITQKKLGDRAMMVDVSAAWHIHCDVLEAVLNAQAPPPFWSKLTRLKSEYAERIPEA